LNQKQNNMLKAIRSRWAVKIFLAIFTVVMLSGIIHTIAMNLSIATAFDRHLGRMGENMQKMMRGMRGDTLFQSFRAAVNDSLVLSAVAAFIIAIIASVFFSRLITKPVKSLIQANRSITQGDYSHRIPESEIQSDELGQLGMYYNRMADHLEQTEKRRRELIADISHELRTPLTAIKGSMEGLMDKVLKADDTTFTQVHAEADRLQRLVEDLQELSLVEASSFTLKKEWIALPDVVNRAISAMKNAYRLKHVSLAKEFDDPLPKISADPDRILQVIQNLLANALQFTDEYGKVVVAVKKKDSQLHISIRDTGIGIEKKDLPYVFERFYRVDKSRSRTGGGGSGIGLTISKSLVEAHGGNIWVESEGRGRGSNFSFSIPL